MPKPCLAKTWRRTSHGYLNPWTELTEMKISGKRLPNVRGMGAKDAVYLMETYGLKVRLAGVGKVVSQSIAAGSYVRRGQTIKLTLK